MKLIHSHVNILSNFSKVYEKHMFDIMAEYFADILSKHQCGFRKDNLQSTQPCLLVLMEKWKKMRDKRGSFEELLTELQKAFGCLLQDLLTAKLNTYGFDFTFLKLVSNCISNRKQS